MSDATLAHRRAYDGPPNQTMRTAYDHRGAASLQSRAARRRLKRASRAGSSRSRRSCCSSPARTSRTCSSRERLGAVARSRYVLRSALAAADSYASSWRRAWCSGCSVDAAGIVIAFVGGRFVRGVLLPNVAWTDSTVDGRVLAHHRAYRVRHRRARRTRAGAARNATRPVLSAQVRCSRRWGAAQRARTVLTIAQAALSVVLLVGAGLFVRSLWNVYGLHLGIEPEKVLTVSFDWPAAADRSDDGKKRERLRQYVILRARQLARVRALPGVEHAARPRRHAVSILDEPWLAASSRPRFDSATRGRRAVHPGRVGRLLRHGGHARAAWRERSRRRTSRRPSASRS